MVKIKEDPFKKASAVPKRLKLFLYGDTGTGKTITALQAPGVAIIDNEHGTDQYQDSFQFKRLKTTSYDDIVESVRWLATNNHKYKTLVIDSMTLVWEMLQKKWSEIYLIRNKGSKGYKHEFYEMAPKEWAEIKSDLKSLMRLILDLDMNVIITAHEKVKYKEAGFMVSDGVTFDCEKKMPYLFDVVIRLFRDGDKYMAEVIKERHSKGKKLPDVFENKFSVYADVYGDAFEREVTPIKFLTKQQHERILELFGDLGATPNDIKKGLENYNVTKIEELKHDDAKTVIENLEKLLKTHAKNLNKPESEKKGE